MKITDDKKVKADLLMASLFVRDVTSDWYRWAICIDLLWICLLLWSHGFSVSYKLSRSKIYGKEHLSDTDGTCNQRFMPCLLWERKQFGRGLDLDSISYQSPWRHTGTTKSCHDQFAHLGAHICQLAVLSYPLHPRKIPLPDIITQVPSMSGVLCTWKTQLVFVMIIFGVWCLAQTL